MLALPAQKKRAMSASVGGRLTEMVVHKSESAIPQPSQLAANGEASEESMQRGAAREQPLQASGATIPTAAGNDEIQAIKHLNCQLRGGRRTCRRGTMAAGGSGADGRIIPVAVAAEEGEDAIIDRFCAMLLDTYLLVIASLYVIRLQQNEYRATTARELIYSTPKIIFCFDMEF